jgi:hypothetical protein
MNNGNAGIVERTERIQNRTFLFRKKRVLSIVHTAFKPSFLAIYLHSEWYDE